MAECHVVHLGRDSRIRPATVRIRRSPDGSLIVDFLCRDQAVPVTEIMMTDAQARALADELTGGLVTRLTVERDEVQEDLKKAQIRHGFGVSRSWVHVRPAPNPGGGDVLSTAPMGGSIPPPSTTTPMSNAD